MNTIKIPTDLRPSNRVNVNVVSMNANSVKRNKLHVGPIAPNRA